SWLLRLSVEATSPATSILAPWPTRIPDGLMRNTLPLDVSVPSNSDGSGPTTRLRTLDAAFCWMKRVVSPPAIENPCQLMMAPGLLVMLSVAPCWEIATWPLTTCGPTGLPCAAGSHDRATSANSSLRSNGRFALLTRAIPRPSRRKPSVPTVRWPDCEALGGEKVTCWLFRRFRIRSRGKRGREYRPCFRSRPP